MKKFCYAHVQCKGSDTKHFLLPAHENVVGDTNETFISNWREMF